MISNEDLKAIRDRADRADDGPWFIYNTKAYTYTHGPNHIERDGASSLVLEDVSEPNGDFIAHARTDVPALVDMIEELEAINGGLRKWQNVARPKLEARIKELEDTT